MNRVTSPRVFLSEGENRPVMVRDLPDLFDKSHLGP